MGRPPRYSAQFQREAVEMVLSSGRTQADVATSLQMSAGTLGNWVRAARRGRVRADDPLPETEIEELRRLRRELAELKIDHEILRKAAAYFARETIR